jgi:hypothetical protein
MKALVDDSTELVDLTRIPLVDLIRTAIVNLRGLH